jgi:hypothetical protein
MVASATGDSSEAHDADERVEQGGGAARMTTTLELTPECGSAGGTLSIRLGLAGLLSLLPWRRRKYDGDDDWGITDAGGCGAFRRHKRGRSETDVFVVRS